MHYFTVRGSPYRCGLQIGRKLRSLIKERLVLMKITIEKVQQHLPELRKIHALCQKQYPQYLEELRGYSVGSGINYWSIFLLNCSQFGSDHGCTSIAVNDKNKTILAHNEDGSDTERLSHCALIHYIQKNSNINSNFHAFVYAGELAGNAYTWNSSGLFFSVNNIPTKTTSGLPRFFIARSLCSAKNISHALSSLRKVPSDNGFHYTLGQDKKIISVEHYGKKLIVKEIKGRYYHTNHFLSKPLSSLRQPSADSSQRLARLQELSSEEDPRKILLDRKNRDHPLYGLGESEKRTLSQVIFDARKRRVAIYTPRLWKKFRL